METITNSALQPLVDEIVSFIFSNELNDSKMLNGFCQKLEMLCIVLSTNNLPQQQIKEIFGIPMYHCLPNNYLVMLKENYPNLDSYLQKVPLSSNVQCKQATFLFNLLAVCVNLFLTCDQDSILIQLRRGLIVFLTLILSHKHMRRFSTDIVKVSNIIVFLKSPQVANLLTFPYDSHLGHVMHPYSIQNKRESARQKLLSAANRVFENKEMRIYEEDLLGEDFSFCQQNEIVEFMLLSEIIWKQDKHPKLDKYTVTVTPFQKYPTQVLLQIYAQYVHDLAFDHGRLYRVLTDPKSSSAHGVSEEASHLYSELSVKHRIHKYKTSLDTFVKKNLQILMEKSLSELHMKGFSHMAVPIERIAFMNTNANGFFDKLEAAVVEVEFFVDLGKETQNNLWQDAKIGDVFWLAQVNLSSDEKLFPILRQLVVFSQIMNIPPSNRERRLFRFSMNPEVLSQDGQEFYSNLSDSPKPLLLFRSFKKINLASKVSLLGDRLLRYDDISVQEKQRKIQEFNKSELNLNYNLKFKSHTVNKTKLFFSSNQELDVQTAAELYQERSLEFTTDFDKVNQKETLFIGEVQEHEIVSLSSDVLYFKHIDQIANFLEIKLLVLSRVAHDAIACFEGRDFGEYLDFTSTNLDEIKNMSHNLDKSELYLSPSELIIFIEQHLLTHTKSKEKLRKYSSQLDIHLLYKMLVRLVPLGFLGTPHLRKQYLICNYFSSCIIDIYDLVSDLYHTKYFVSTRRKFSHIVFSTEYSKKFPLSLLRIVNLQFDCATVSTNPNSSLARPNIKILYTDPTKVLHLFWKVYLDALVTENMENLSVIVPDDTLRNRVESSSKAQSIPVRLLSRGISKSHSFIIISFDFDSLEIPPDCIHCLLHVLN